MTAMIDALRWRRPSRLLCDRPPAPLHDWLLDEGSLTARLRAAGGTFRVIRLHQGWQRPRRDEAKLLRLRPERVALIREVLLEVDGAAVVFARSVFPHRTLSGPLRYLRKLRNRSLGEILFARPELQRSAFEVVRLPPWSTYLPPRVRNGGRPWARRSVFALGSCELLVSEVFIGELPPVPRLGNQHYRFHLRGR